MYNYDMSSADGISQVKTGIMPLTQHHEVATSRQTSVALKVQAYGIISGDARVNCEWP